jgi:hypothetical protein
MEFCAFSHAESARHIAQTPAIFSTQSIQVIGILRDQDLSIDVRKFGRPFTASGMRSFARIFGKCSSSVARDGSPLGLADQLGEPSLAVDHRQVAQVVAVMLDQVEGEQHRLTATALAPERMEVRRPVIAGDHDLAVDQERLRLEVGGGFHNSREAVRLV